MDTSFYQDLKPVIMNVFGLSKDAIHIYVGFFTFLLSCHLMKGKFRPLLVLLPGLLLSILMELMDILGDIHLGRRLDWWGSCHDLINTNVIPVVTYFVFMRRRKDYSS